MIELRVRGRIERVLDPIGRTIAALGVTPTVLTLIGLAATLVGAALIGTGDIVRGALVALAGSALDGLDGTVARASGRASPRGALLDSVADRLGETGLWAGLAFWLAEQGRPVPVLLCVLSLGAALLVSYMRAKAEAQRLDGRGGLMGRAERLILFTVGLVLGWVEPMLWTMAVLTWLTVAQRFARTWRALEGADPEAVIPPAWRRG